MPAANLPARRPNAYNQPTMEDRVVGQIDDLERVADEGRNQVLGQQYFSNIRRWYNFDPPGQRRVSYHPLIRVADLQMMTLREAAELTAPQPKFFLSKRQDGVRDEQREKAFNAMWNHLEYQMELFYACCHAGMGGTGFIQAYFDPDYDDGIGAVRILARDPETCFPDPSAKTDENLAYMIVEDFLTVEEIAQRYGNLAAGKVSLEREGTGTSGRIPKTFLDFPASATALPPGPLRTMGPLGGGAFSSNAGEAKQSRIRVRTMFIKDSTTVPFTEELAYYLVTEEKIIPEPNRVPAFPNGRIIVEAQRRLLFDGANPYRGIPIFRVPAMPPLFGYWAPPPVRYTQDLQQLAEEMLSQVYENAYRMNNVMMFVQRISGLTSNDISGLPGTVYFTEPAAGDKPVQIVTPPQFPAHFLEYPKFLLQLQQELRGMMPSRQGKSSAGNVGMGLFDSEVYQSQALTRMRSRLLGSAIQKIAAFTFATMIDLGDSADRTYPYVDGGTMSEAIWKYDPELAQKQWRVTLDANSMRVDSATSLRNLGLALGRMGLIDEESLFEWLDAPDPERLTERLKKKQMQQMLMAMMAGQQPGQKKTGGKK